MFHFISGHVPSLSLFAAQATPGAPVNRRVVKLAIDSVKAPPSIETGGNFWPDWRSSMSNSLSSYPES